MSPDVCVALTVVGLRGWHKVVNSGREVKMVWKTRALCSF